MVVNILSLRLDHGTCANYLMRLDNATVKNVIFVLQATVPHSKACPKKVFGVFDTWNVEVFRLENVTVQGDVFLERYASVSVGGIFSYYGLILPEVGSTSSIVVPQRLAWLDQSGMTLFLHDTDTVVKTIFTKIRHNVEVHRLKMHYFNAPVINRRYEKNDFEDVSPPLDTIISFNDNELKSQ